MGGGTSKDLYDDDGSSPSEANLAAERIPKKETRKLMLKIRIEDLLMDGVSVRGKSVDSSLDNEQAAWGIAGEIVDPLDKEEIKQLYLELSTYGSERKKLHDLLLAKLENGDNLHGQSREDVLSQIPNPTEQSLSMWIWAYMHGHSLSTGVRLSHDGKLLLAQLLAGESEEINGGMTGARFDNKTQTGTKKSRRRERREREEEEEDERMRSMDMGTKFDNKAQTGGLFDGDGGEDDASSWSLNMQVFMTMILMVGVTVPIVYASRLWKKEKQLEERRAALPLTVAAPVTAQQAVAAAAVAVPPIAQAARAAAVAEEEAVDAVAMLKQEVHEALMENLESLGFVQANQDKSPSEWAWAYMKSSGLEDSVKGMNIFIDGQRRAKIFRRQQAEEEAQIAAMERELADEQAKILQEMNIEDVDVKKEIYAALKTSGFIGGITPDSPFIINSMDQFAFCASFFPFYETFALCAMGDPALVAHNKERSVSSRDYLDEYMMGFVSFLTRSKNGDPFAACIAEMIAFLKTGELDSLPFIGPLAYPTTKKDQRVLFDFSMMSICPLSIATVALGLRMLETTFRHEGRTFFWAPTGVVKEFEPFCLMVMQFMIKYVISPKAGRGATTFVIIAPNGLTFFECNNMVTSAFSHFKNGHRANRTSQLDTLVAKFFPEEKTRYIPGNRELTMQSENYTAQHSPVIGADKLIIGKAIVVTIS